MSLYKGTDLISGHQVLYSTTGQNTDGAMTQAATTNALNGKADIDLNNVNATGTSVSAGWAMPSSTYKTLTLGASGTEYTAPANGWVSFRKVTGIANGYISIVSTSGRQVSQQAPSTNYGLSALLQLAKGETYTVTYTATGTTFHFRFYYAVGSESEAT